MATGRTHPKWQKVYIDGYDMTGYARKVGPLETSFDEANLSTVADAALGYLPGMGHVKVNNYNGVLDNDAAGLRVLASGASARRIVTVGVGIRATLAQGDPCFTAQAYQLSYGEQDEGGAATVSLPFAEYATDASTLLYTRGWGVVLNANAARTATNTDTGVDDYGAATARGGYMVYHITDGDGGSATLKVQDAAVNADGSFSDLSGASAAITSVAAGSSGIVALTPTATVRRYLRWQVSFTTAATVTFFLAFVRG